MSSESTTVVIGDAGADRVVFRAIRRTSPDADDFWDGNWIDSEVELAVGGFRGGYAAYLRSNEFDSFRKGLVEISETLRGEAEFTTMEGQIELRLTTDRVGHIKVTGRAEDQAGIGNRLTFEFEIDQTCLASTIRSLDELLRVFPVFRDSDAS